jgi:DNA-directed RNA polymerase specialized sigma24 family protein
LASRMAARGLRRRATRRDPSSPNNREWIENTLKPLAQRKLAGEDPVKIGEELFQLVRSWVWSQIRKEQARCPAGGDPQEIASRMLCAAWRICQKFDPERPASWPTALQASLRGAWLEAYRASDFLTRKHRATHNALRAVIEHQTQLLGRQLTPQECQLLAQSVAPPSSATDWAQVLLERPTAPPLGGLGQDLALDMPCDGSSRELDPEAALEDRETLRDIEEWLATLPPGTRQQVRRCMELGRPLPAKVRQQVAASVPHHLLAPR